MIVAIEWIEPESRDEARHRRRMDSKRRYRLRHREDLARKQREYLVRNADVVKQRKRAAVATMTDAQRERHNRYHRKRYAAQTDEQRERQRAYERGWREANTAAINLRRARTRAADPEKYREHHRKWRSRNVERERERYRRYYAANRERMLARARYRHLPRDWVAVPAGDPCAYCGGAMEHVEHIEPVARGGDNGWENLAASCARCNARKGVKSLLHFLSEEARRGAYA